MIFLYILAVIAIILIILLHSPFKIYIECKENKFSIAIRYLFLKKTLLPNRSKAKKKKKEKSKSNKKPRRKKNNKENRQNKKANNSKDNKKKKSFFPDDKDERIAFIINVLKSSGKALKHFTKRIIIKDIRADINISDEDACECAVKFGKANIAVYNILSFTACFFRMKKKYININCLYNKPESIYNFSFTVKFTPSAGIFSAIAFIFTFLANNKKAEQASVCRKS